MTDKADIQVDTSIDPIHVYVPAHLDAQTLKQYLQNAPASSKQNLMAFEYLETPHTLFQIKYLVRLYPYIGTPYVQLQKNCISVYKRATASPYKILDVWTKKYLLAELNTSFGRWEEHLNKLVDVACFLGKNLTKSDFRIDRDQKKIFFSTRLIHMEWERVNFIVLRAILLYLHYSKPEYNRIVEQYFPKRMRAFD